MTCVFCGRPLRWGDTLIQRFRMNSAEEIEPGGYAHSYHYENEEEN